MKKARNFEKSKDKKMLIAERKGLPYSTSSKNIFPAGAVLLGYTVFSWLEKN